MLFKRGSSEIFALLAVLLISGMVLIYIFQTHTNKEKILAHHTSQKLDQFSDLQKCRILYYGENNLKALNYLYYKAKLMGCDLDVTNEVQPNEIFQYSIFICDKSLDPHSLLLISKNLDNFDKHFIITKACFDSILVGSDSEIRNNLKNMLSFFRVAYESKITLKPRDIIKFSVVNKDYSNKNFDDSYYILKNPLPIFMFQCEEGLIYQWKFKKQNFPVISESYDALCLVGNTYLLSFSLKDAEDNDIPINSLLNSLLHKTLKT